MASYRPRRRRTDKKGRSKGTSKFVKLDSWLLTSPAWKELGPYERTVYLELKGFFNGSNNGEIFLSCRQAALRCNMSKDRANLAFKELREAGFIRNRTEDRGPFEERNAQCLILTEEKYLEREATKDFMSRPTARSK